MEKQSFSSENLTGALQRLQNFNATHKLQQAVATYITSQILKQEEVEELKKSFISLDHNHDGRLSHKELMDGYNKAMNLHLTKKELNEIIAKVDSDGSGYIEYNEFITSTVTANIMLTKKNLEYAFSAFDKDKSGSISVKEVRMIFSGGSQISRNSSVQDSVFLEII
jgi:calcium-dependent protein kinase